jgi:hypothetical protein
MSLVVRVSVNDGPNIAVLAAQRVAGGTDPDSMNSYLLDAWHIPLGTERFVPVAEQVPIEHRYGDGALELVKKMVEALT